MFTEGMLNDAMKWRCQQRKRFPPDADIWHLRFHWNTIRPQLLVSLNAGTYRLSPMQLIRKANGETIALWSSQDALVIRCLTQLLTPIFPAHPQCEHLRGHGGGKQSIHRVHHHLREAGYHYICRTDIRGYYGNINKDILFRQCKKHVSDPMLLSLSHQFIHYSVEDSGEFHTPKKGISRSASLSPLLAAFHLTEVDKHFANKTQIYYARYMDDFIIFTRTRWQLRRMVRRLNTFFNQFGFHQHPHKSFIGKLTKGFDWMGFWFTNQGCQSVAPLAIKNHANTLRRLYEQTRKQPAERQAARVAAYVTRWSRWVNTSLPCALYVRGHTYVSDVLKPMAPSQEWVLLAAM